MTSLTVPLQLRHGTAAAWTSANPILLSGEKGVETDTGLEKIGNGTSHWTALPYQFDHAGAAATAQTAAAADATTKVAAEATARTAAITTAVDALVNGAPGALNTLNELATALGDDQAFATTVTNALAAKAPLTSAALVTPTINGHTPVTADQAGTVFDPAGAAAGLALVFGV